MGKILVVAEKPSVARDIAKVLGSNKRGQGFLDGDKYIISWAVGHLIALADPEDYNASLKKWRIETLPIIPQQLKLKEIKATKDQLEVLKSLMNADEVDSIICATDAGREGELIFRYVYEYTKSKKPFSRLWISSMADKAIKDGFDNLKPGQDYDNLYYSAKCRNEADWLVGINASRAFTLRYNTLLSIGRVQTPTLAIIVQRHKEIEAFDIREYYEVVADYGSFTGTWFLKDVTETKIFEIEKAKEIAEKVKNTKGIVESAEKEEKRQPPPLLYDLTELQRDCNKKFGFSAQKTLSVAQNLYEKSKLITYPRTDSRYLSEDMKGKVKSTLNKLYGTNEYKPFCEEILKNGGLTFSKRIIDDSKVTDHHAIIPTDVNIKLNSISDEERKVYNLIALRFLAVFYDYYIYTSTKIIISSKEETFVSKGTTIIQEGWTALNKHLGETKKKKDGEVEVVLPILAKGDEVDIVNAEAVKKKTTPPKAYTEATLLSAMENAGKFIEDETLKEQLKESGLGTPATRASIIERLITVGYIIREKKSLVPTEKGIKLIEVVPEQLKSPETTGKWEKGLSSISKGKMDKERFMGSIERFVHYLVNQGKQGDNKVVFKEDEKTNPKGGLGKCPLCGNGEIFENKKAFFCSGWRNGCKFTMWKNSLDRYANVLDTKKVKKLLKDKKIDNITCAIPQTGEKGTATLILNKNLLGDVELMNFKRDESQI